MKRINEICGKLFEVFPDALTGRESTYKREFYFLYGEKNFESNISYMKRKVFKRYLAVLAGFIILLTAAGISVMTSGGNVVCTDGNGSQYIKRPLQGDTAKYAALQIEAYNEETGKPYKKSVELKIAPYKKLDEEQKNKEEVSKTVGIETEISMAVRAAEKSEDKEAVYLPVEIKGLKQIIWKEEKKHTGMIIFVLGIMTAAAIYAGRFGEIKRLKKESMISVEEELPDFLNKTVLLMNSGLVLSAAFERIVEDYKKGEKKQSYFYGQLSEIVLKMKETNCSMISELKAFAERTGNRAFIRIANIMNENVHKGTALAETLESESSFLWFQRKKKAEEQGKIAETKLTVPLAMELVALIMITLMPALLEM